MPCAASANMQCKLFIYLALLALHVQLSTSLTQISNYKAMSKESRKVVKKTNNISAKGWFDDFIYWTQSLHSKSAQPGPEDQYYFLHIPKAAGLSFGDDAMQMMHDTSHHVVSREGCFSYGEKHREFKGVMAFFRRPTNHIFSMYKFCNSGNRDDYRSDVHKKGRPKMPDSFAGWIRAWAAIHKQGFSGDFKPSPTKVGTGLTEAYVRKYRVEAWERPPFSAFPTKLDPANWQNLDGGGTLWHMVDVPFECYPPINLQTHRMTCEHPMEYPKQPPSVEQAISNMEKAFFVGIVEAYQSSLCLLHSKIYNSLPPTCDCDAEGMRYPFHHTNPTDDNLANQSRETFEESAELISDDAKLYDAAWKRFLRETKDVEQKFGMRILCESNMWKSFR